jgi:hypothetical protein
MWTKKSTLAIVIASVLVVLAALRFCGESDEIDSPLPVRLSPINSSEMYSGVPNSSELTPRAYLLLLAGPLGEYSAVNLGFEGGTHNAARWWVYPSTAPFDGGYDEIQPGKGWTAWWIEKRPCPGADDWATGRPEVKVIGRTPDPLRVAEGNKALQAFTFYRCGWFGVCQQALFPGGTYRLGAKIHAWYSSCDDAPHALVPLDSECSPVEDEHLWIRLGADVQGKADLYSPSLAWGADYERYGVYAADYFWSDWFTVNGPGMHLVTLWIGGESTLPLKHVDIYIDDVILQEMGK